MRKLRVDLAGSPLAFPRRGALMPLRVSRIGVGLNPTTPLKQAGILTEPPMSVPRPSLFTHTSSTPLINFGKGFGRGKMRKKLSKLLFPS